VETRVDLQEPLKTLNITKIFNPNEANIVKILNVSSTLFAL
jgi:hypothetical protein